MIFVYYEEQRSFAEYIDMTFKELHCKDEYVFGEGLPLYSHKELFDFVIEGYWPQFGYMPMWIERMLDCNKPRIQKRRLKKWCKNLFDQYGETVKVMELHDAFNKELEEYEKQWPEVDDDLGALDIFN